MYLRIKEIKTPILCKLGLHVYRDTDICVKDTPVGGITSERCYKAEVCRRCHDERPLGTLSCRIFGHKFIPFFSEEPNFTAQICERCLFVNE